MKKALEGIGAFHAGQIEWFVVAHFDEGRMEAAAAIARAYRTEAGQAVVWGNGSPRALEGRVWMALWEMGVNLS